METVIQSKKIAKKYKVEHPEWFKNFRFRRIVKGNLQGGRPEEHYHPDLVALIRKELEERLPIAQEGWMTNGALRDQDHVAFGTIRELAEQYRSQHPEWFQKLRFARIGRVAEHFHPDLVELIHKELQERRNSGAHLEHEVSEREQKQKEVADFAQEVRDDITGDAKKFATLVAFCGGSRALDILYALRPDYRRLPLEFMQSVISDYLGDYLLARHNFSFADVGKIPDIKIEGNLLQGLIENLKLQCLQYYYHRRLEEPTADSHKIIYDYLDQSNATLQNIPLGHLRTALVDAVLEASTYFVDAFSLAKPTNLVESLGSDREFPDVNQRVNTLELQNKNRLLIADEMGLGKSASVIFAKEFLKKQRAILVIPADVIPTWLGYLSSDPERKGCFKPGKEPRVLVIDDLSKLNPAVAKKYDYILISQQRFGSKNGDQYVERLKQTDFDMMVIDEVHKVKRLSTDPQRPLRGADAQTGQPAKKKWRSGVISRRVMQLVQQVNEKEGGHLALLSGTPIPNKVGDVATILKMLHPEKFKSVPDANMLAWVFNADALELRQLLVPYMQRKKLEDSVKMPDKYESVAVYRLSDLEAAVYEAILENDELEAGEQLRLLRAFLVNPRLLEVSPDILGTKIQQLGKSIDDAFERTQKIVVFVNDFVEGVLWGEHTIIEALQLPPDVATFTIHGSNRKDRQIIQKSFTDQRGRCVLFVSGKTADVGVDFSAAGEVIEYNEPWTQPDEDQQIARVYRPGLERQMYVQTLIGSGTIEQGIHLHKEAKNIAILKLLEGIPLSELEKNLLKAAEEDNGEGSIEVNPELALYYVSIWRQMMRMFGSLKEVGEVNFRKFLADFGRHYAEGYKEIGSRSYQANANRVSGTIISHSMQNRGEQPDSIRILDVASGPEMLRRHISEPYQQHVVSLDLNDKHFEHSTGECKIGSFLEMPFVPESFDYVHFGLAWDQTQFLPSKGKLERLQVLCEFNRVVKTGGRVVLNNIYSSEQRDPAAFVAVIALFGFKIVDEYSGTVQSGKKFNSGVITLEKVETINQTPEQLMEIIRERQLQEGLKFKDTEVKLIGSRRILESFDIDGRPMTIDLNNQDRALLQEEKDIERAAENLKERYGGVAKIPPEVVEVNGFARFNDGKGYVLFKRLSGGSGVILIR